jgi:hypothetical protein
MIKMLGNKNISLKLAILLATIILIAIPTVSAENIHSFFGTFYPNNESMVLRFSYFFPEKAQEIAEYNYSSYSIEFLNSNQNVLRTYKPYIISINESDWFGVLIDVPNTTAYVKFKYNDIVLNNLSITSNTPIVENISVTNISTNLYNIIWDASDSDGDDLTYLIYYHSNYMPNWQWNLISNDITDKN